MGDDTDNDDGNNKNDDSTTISMKVKKMKLASNAEYIATQTSITRSSICKLNKMQQYRSMLYGFSRYDKNKQLTNHSTDEGFIDDNIERRYDSFKT